MSTTPSDSRNSNETTTSLTKNGDGSELLNLILEILDDAKAEEVISIDLEGKSSFGDYMVIASGRSNRHVSAIADQITRKLKESGHTSISVEGLGNADWVLIDTGDVIVHVFRPEVREFYNLEKMWMVDNPGKPQIV